MMVPHKNTRNKKKLKIFEENTKNAKKKVETVLREERWRDKSSDELGSSRDSTQPQGGVINQTFREKHLRFIHILFQIYSYLDESTCGNVNISGI